MAETPQLPLLPEPNRHQSNPTDTRTAGVRVCGVLNIIAGCAGGFGGLILQMFGPNIIASMLLLAGVLSAVSGVCLLFSPQRTRSVAIGLLALAVVLSLIFSVFVVMEVGSVPVRRASRRGQCVARIGSARHCRRRLLPSRLQCRQHGVAGGHRRFLFL